MHSLRRVLCGHQMFFAETFTPGFLQIISVSSLFGSPTQNVVVVAPVLQTMVGGFKTFSI